MRGNYAAVRLRDCPEMAQGQPHLVNGEPVPPSWCWIVYAVMFRGSARRSLITEGIQYGQGLDARVHCGRAFPASASPKAALKGLWGGGAFLRRQRACPVATMRYTPRIFSTLIIAARCTLPQAESRRAADCCRNAQEAYDICSPESSARVPTAIAPSADPFPAQPRASATTAAI
jgi:hypothetical protein